MNIKIVEISVNDDYAEIERKVEVNDFIDQESFFLEFSDVLYVRNRGTLSYLLQQSLASLSYFFQAISYEYKPEWSLWEYEFYVGLGENQYNEEEKPESAINSPLGEYSMDVYFKVDLKNWNFPFSITDFEIEIEKYIKNNKINVAFSEMDESRYDLKGEMCFRIDLKNKGTDALIEVQDKAVDLIRDIHLSVFKKMQERIYPELLTTFFEFPEEIKTSCKQYLVYFAQFLADMGIQATTSIKEDANKVLFTVTPEDETVALSKIQEALTVYLNAPTFENISNDVLNKDVAVLQWESNIYHLKSQLALSKALLQTKDATIEALQLSNYQLKQMISSENDKKNLLGTNKEEELIKGVVSVKKYDGKAFSVDLPEILRKLKRKFKSNN